MFLLARRCRPVLGLDMTGSSIRLIELATRRGQYCVEAFAAEPMPQSTRNENTLPDPDVAAAIIRRAVRRAGTHCRHVALAIGREAGITKVIQMPCTLDDHSLEQQLQLQLEQLVPFPPEEVSFDFEVLGPSLNDPSTNDVLLVASRTDYVECYAAAAVRAGLTAHIADLKPFAQESACRLLTHQMPDGGIDRTIAVIDFGLTSATFSVLRNLEVIHARDFAPSPIVDETALQVSRSLQFYLASARGHERPDQILVCGERSDLESVSEAIQHRLSIPAQPGDPLGQMKISANAQANGIEHAAAALLTACGLALRSFD